jgi:hypothetical protein
MFVKMKIMFIYPNVAKMKDKRDIQGLIRALAYKEKRKSEYGDYWLEEYPFHDVAAYALASLGRDAVAPLIIGLKSQDPKVRAGACTALGKIGEPSVVDHLTIALDDKDAGVRVKATEALGAIGDKSAIVALIDNYRKKGNSLAIEELGRIGDPSTADLLLDTINNRRFPVNISKLMEKFGDDRAVMPLVAILTDDNGKLGDKICASSALETLKNKVSYKEPMYSALNEFHSIYRNGMSEDEYRKKLSENRCQHDYLDWRNWDLATWGGNSKWAEVNNVRKCTKCGKIVYGE